MKPKKAIKILRWMAATGVITCLDEDKKALELGIEALKRLDDHRHGKTLPFERLLPGESEE